MKIKSNINIILTRQSYLRLSLSSPDTSQSLLNIHKAFTHYCHHNTDNNNGIRHILMPSQYYFYVHTKKSSRKKKIIRNANYRKWYTVQNFLSVSKHTMYLIYALNVLSLSLFLSLSISLLLSHIMYHLAVVVYLPYTYLASPIIKL